MILDEIQDFYHSIKSSKAVLLCIDYGLKKVGFAVTAPGLILGFPYTTIHYYKQSQLTNEIISIIQEKKITGIVIGLPLRLNNDESEQTIKTKKFAQHLDKACNLPIYLQDERLTTRGAHSYLKLFGISRKARSEKSDNVAASLILEIVLEKFQRLSQ